MQKLVVDLSQSRVLDKEESYQLMKAIITGEIGENVVAALLFGLQMRGVTLGEMIGFRNALMEFAIHPELSTQAIDFAGTGGDGKNTINISTLSSVVISSMGFPVIKHGNYSSTSVTGSTQILELLGYQFTQDKKYLQSQFEKFGYCYLHAPLFHPSLAKVAGVRKQLKMRTIFNILGPLCNPSNPQYRFHGTNSISLARLYSHFFNTTNFDFAIFHSLDGHDEISLTSQYLFFTKNSRKIFSPHDEGIELLQENHIQNGKTPEQAIQIFTNILKGKGTISQHTLIAYNVAKAIQLIQPHQEFLSLYEHTLEHILYGKPYEHIVAILQFQKNNLA